MIDHVILVCGNRIDPDDCGPIQLLPKLEERFITIKFVPWDPTEEIPPEAGNTLIVIDTVQGIDSPKLFNTLDSFILSPRNTVHDFDLPVALTLLKKAGVIHAVRLIGVPQQRDYLSYFEQLSTIISLSILS